MSIAKQDYVEQLQTRLQRLVSEQESELVTQFAQMFWARTLEDDLAERDVTDDAGATLACWRRLGEHQDDQVRITLANPVHARDGWQSSHTIVGVIAPDMPFMVDSVLMALSHDGLVTHLLNNVVLALERADDGTPTHLSTELEHANRELLIYAEIDRLDDVDLPALKQRLEAMAAELQAVVADYEPMTSAVTDILQELRDNPPALPAAEIDEGIAFLDWMLEDHFTFLGYREFEYVDGIMRQSGPALGMQRVRASSSERLLADQPEETRQFLMTPSLLTFSKAGTKSRVHRPTYPDYVGVKRFDASGQVVGEIGFLGLYTSRVYMEFPDRIPEVRQKVANVQQRSGLDPRGFDGKVLAEVLSTYPRDELFQISEDELLANTMVITDIHERRRVRVFPRYEAYGLFVTVLVYMPRDLFNTHVRLAVHNLLVDTFDAEDADYDAYLSESILVRLQYNLRIRHGNRSHVDRVDLEQRITKLIGDWTSEFNAALVNSFGDNRGRRLYKEYAAAFSAGYQEEFVARTAVDDVASIEDMDEATPLSTRFYRQPEDPQQLLRLKIYSLGETLPLSDVIPKLENMGLRIHGEHPFPVKRATLTGVSVHNFELATDSAQASKQSDADFNDAFVRIWNGQAEDDSYNRLVLTAGLNWRQISVLRAYAQYMKQIRMGLSQAFISNTLDKHRAITKALVAYFETRFEPSSGTQQQTDSASDLTALREPILAALEDVELLNEDRVLRRFLELIDATKRTNYFQTKPTSAGQSVPEHRPYLALKFAPGEIANIPKPAPVFEIFVSAPYFEGVHLRGGPIARGGLRWSDRLEDYRTEVLGLVKAQVVKNAVIVPTGAKGGFVVKGNHEGVACYRDFIRGLLDTTDNIIDGSVVTPPGVRAYDGEDPYLVVAADKGTATFSDEANNVANEYGFWLGDAFASGGSNGYDHKKMGITAKGAWVSVQRHFSERDIDVQKQPVTVLGIGDMGGDVFGNGMLSSRCLQLVAAFNHMHIFIDPQPDPEVSFAERERLFALPRSSWADYNEQLMSAGGGIFPRTAKSIDISPAMKTLFAIEEDALAPDELINRLLKSPVQLIWNGGIGTYVKASSEANDEVGDRANDHLRVDARDLHCQVFGEGGNLGLTQRARIEFCLNGGAVNTDFIDNSAGVDCSDHEVNIKIALNAVVAQEDMTVKQRNALLAEMTDDVSDIVLMNNYRQAQTLSLAQRHAAARDAEYRRAISYLEQHAGLDRELEYLPTDEQLSERFAEGEGLTRPELAVLLAYAKTHIKNELIQSNLHGDPLIAEQLFTSFPARLVAEHRDVLQAHRLAGEVCATQLANDIVDHMGITFVLHLIDYVGGSAAEVVRAYSVVAHCFEIPQWFEEIRQLDDVAMELRLNLLQGLQIMGRRATRWVMRHRGGGASVQTLVAGIKPSLTQLIDARDDAVGEQGQAWQQRVTELVGAGLPEGLATRSAYASVLARLLPIIDVAEHKGCDPLTLSATTTMVGHELHLDWLSSELANFDCHSHWQAMERDALLDDLTLQQSRLGAGVLADSEGDVAEWFGANAQFAHAWREVMDEARQTSVPDFSMYAMMTRKLADLLPG